MRPPQTSPDLEMTRLNKYPRRGPWLRLPPDRRGVHPLPAPIGKAALEPTPAQKIRSRATHRQSDQVWSAAALVAFAVVYARYSHRILAGSIGLQAYRSTFRQVL